MSWLEYLKIPFTNPELILIAAVGTFAGFLIGSMPGLSVTMAVTLLVSLSYTWDTIPAIVLIIGVFFGGVYGGSRSAILLNIPGTPSSLATTFDGYPLTQRGESGLAIGYATLYSVFGGLLGILVLATASPLISSIALSFAPRDYFLIMLLGILLVGSLGSTDYKPKSIFAAGLGIIVGLIGMDALTATDRFTLGTVELKGGISFIACLLGLFGLAEVLHQLHSTNNHQSTSISGKLLPSMRQFVQFLPLSLRTSTIGVMIGSLPGAGGEIASIMAYDHAKRTVKKPSRPFGKGAYEGVLAPDTANMAAIGGALIPMLTLGIPGDAVTAVIIGGLMIHGLTPGPMLMTSSPDLFWVIVGAGILSAIFIFIWGMLGLSLFARVVLIPKHVLLPIIAFLTVVGAYAIRNSITDVYWMIAFGIVGFFMKKYRFPTGPMVLGIILGPMMDGNFRRAVMMEENILGFLISLFSHPISLMLTLIILFTLFSQTSWFQWLKGKWLRQPLSG
ncbi:tripartite tricarboxylate transporter permease [Desmospora activa]|uniref:Putative tricarboxylic transport membrane protein n=1 Tax=Desmospora activa DSM 45169 TaxID=1121389 RepID=A0A2T4Z953_9BACL|nr:tripartite tricarboxylate transporter permease [Desmospora activa]PTM58421.1 putative tricarboxylic transport membrane protein [Desmospora activa DSM 45169]